VLSDTLVVVIGLLAAALIGFRSGYANLDLFYQHFLIKVSVAGLICMLCMYYYDLYEPLAFNNLREVATRLSQVLGTSCVILAIVYYAHPSFQLGRGIFLAGIVLIGLLLVGWRKLFFALNGALGLTQRVILLAYGPMAPTLAHEMESRPELGVRVLGYVGEPPQTAVLKNSFRCLGSLQALPELVENYRVHRVIVTMAERRGQLPLEMLLQLKSQGVRIEDAADVYERLTGKMHLDSLRLSWFVFPPGFRISNATLFYKRVFSIVVSALGLILTLPLMLLVGLAIRLDSPGSALFRQTRIGKDGKVFTLYKLRSMQINADADGIPRPVQDHDERLTRVGRLLRRTRLDELPQLYNILRGDMDFVGPRPFVPAQEEALAREIPFYRHRWAAKPGATGWAQVHRGYCATLRDNTEKLAYDLFYIKNMSVGLDLLILFQTVKILLLGRGAR
jgi:sugar transferase (PEP-CTERM system associated)